MQSDEIEIDLPPIFDIGEKVRVKKLIRNDGTFPGRDIGATLAKKGDTGYVCSIGTFLQTSYIYAVHFIERGNVVGCRARELESAEPERVRNIEIEEDSWDFVSSSSKL